MKKFRKYLEQFSKIETDDDRQERAMEAWRQEVDRLEKLDALIKEARSRKQEYRVRVLERQMAIQTLHAEHRMAILSGDRKKAAFCINELSSKYGIAVFTSRH